MSFIIQEGGLRRLLRARGKPSSMVDSAEDWSLRKELMRLMDEEQLMDEERHGAEHRRWWHKQTVKKETSKQNNQTNKQTNSIIFKGLLLNFLILNY